MFHISQQSQPVSDLGLPQSPPILPGVQFPLPAAGGRCPAGWTGRAVPLRRFRFRVLAAVGRCWLSVPGVCLSVPAVAPSVPGPVLGGAMNRPKAAAVRRPSAVPKPSGESRGAGRRAAGAVAHCRSLSLTVAVAVSPLAAHPPPGDFIALGSKGQSGEGKAAVTLLKPAPPGLPSERKRDAAALAGPAGLPGLTKRPKLSSTPPLSALGRLAEAAVAEKRAISPSIKEPSVIPIEGEGSRRSCCHTEASEKGNFSFLWSLIPGVFLELCAILDGFFPWI